MNILGIFVKQPVPGLVKTRLASDLGSEQAAELYAACVGDIIDRFRTEADSRVVCHAPADEAARRYFHDLAAIDYQLWPQPDGSLGDRLHVFFAEAFRGGAHKVVVIGSDSPTLPARLVNEAFDLLSSHDCVLGPATDGGYYLVGQSGRSRPIFHDIDWSRPTVLRQSIARVRKAAASLALLTPWYDIDSRADLELLRGHVDALKATGQPLDIARLERWLNRSPGERFTAT